jgi:O-antigen ligase
MLLMTQRLGAMDPSLQATPSLQSVRTVTGPLRHRRRSHGTTSANERLGSLLPLLLLWMLFEIGRPPTPPKVPLLLSLIVFAGWLLAKDKRWTRQSFWMTVLLGVMAAGIPFAVNGYSAFWSTYGMASFLCICLPLPGLVTSVRRVRVWVLWFLAIASYVGAWALFHHGFGPSAARGAQDENYVGTLMGMAFPFAYFLLFLEKRFVRRLPYIIMMVVFVGAMVVGRDTSRGAFLGLCATVLYCVALSPRKLLGFGILGAGALGLALLAGPKYWQQIRSTTDTSEGTADLRLEIWQAGLRAWKLRPIMGAGPGNFTWVVQEGESQAQFERLGRGVGGSILAHSFYVEMIVDTGIIGVLIFLAVLGRTVLDLRRVQRVSAAAPGRAPPSDDQRQLHCYADGLLGSIVAVLANGAFLSLFYFVNLWLLLAVGGAIAQVTRRQFASAAGSRYATR